MYSLETKIILEELGYKFKQNENGRYSIIEKELKTYFEKVIWWTPNQIRDSHVDFNYSLTTEYVQELKVLALNEQARRKTLPDEFVECPICKGYHGQLNNFDNICEKHGSQAAIFRYDNKVNH